MSEKKVVFWPKLTDYIFSSPFTKIVFSLHLRLYFLLTPDYVSQWVMFQFGTFFQIVAHNLNNLPNLGCSQLVSLHIHKTSPRVRSLGAGDNRKVRLVTHLRNLS